jgi:hypothetical protein
MVIYDGGAGELVRRFDRGVVYRDRYEPLRPELEDFVGAIRAGEEMGFHTALARSVVRIVEAADRSLVQGGREVALDHGEIGEQLTARREFALA